MPCYMPVFLLPSLSCLPLATSCPAISTTAEALGLQLYPRSSLAHQSRVHSQYTQPSQLTVLLDPEQSQKSPYFKGGYYKESHSPSSGQRRYLKLHKLLPERLGRRECWG